MRYVRVLRRVNPPRHANADQVRTSQLALARLMPRTLTATGGLSPSIRSLPCLVYFSII